MTQYDPGLRDNTVTEWRTRLLLRLGRWDEAYALTRKLPQDLAATSRWRYWQARSLQLAQPNSKEPIALYQKLAGERDLRLPRRRPPERAVQARQPPCAHRPARPATRTQRRQYAPGHGVLQPWRSDQRPP